MILLGAFGVSDRHSAACSGPPELGEEGAKCREGLGHDSEVRPPSALLAFEQTGVGQHLQVMADGGLAQAEWPLQMARAGLAIGLSLDQAQEPETGRNGDHLQGVRELICVGRPERLVEERRAGSSHRCDRLHALILTAIDAFGKMSGRSMAVDICAEEEACQRFLTP
jgi:hypothetical protein